MVRFGHGFDLKKISNGFKNGVFVLDRLLKQP